MRRLVGTLCLVGTLVASCGGDSRPGGGGGSGGAGSGGGGSGGAGSGGGGTGGAGSGGGGAGGRAGAGGGTGGTGGVAGAGGTGGAGATGGTGGGGTSGAFERFFLRTGAGPCPPEYDCSGSVELLADGTLRIDVDGERPVVVHEARVSTSDLAAAIPVLTDPALIALLDLGEPPCVPPTDVFEGMELTLGGVVHDNSTTTCSQPPIAAARATMRRLAETYLPMSRLPQGASCDLDDDRCASGLKCCATCCGAPPPPDAGPPDPNPQCIPMPSDGMCPPLA